MGNAGKGKGPRLAGRVGLAAAALLPGAGLLAGEVAPFRLTGVDGYVDMRYSKDEFATGGAGSRSGQSQGNFRTDVFLMTHSYVYHPAFLSLDIGGGPLLQQSDFSNDGSSTASRGTLYNFSGRATFLKDKPIRGSLFLDHLNPTLTVAPGQVLSQENTRYGFDASASAAVSPVPVRLAYMSTHTVGRGGGRSLDDRIDQFNLNASRAFGALGSTQLQYQASHQESVSGSLDLPIQASTADSQGINLDTRLQLGADRQHDLTNLVAANRRRYTLGTGTLPDQRDFSFLLDLRSRYGPDFSTFALMHQGNGSQGDLESRTRALAGGLTWLPAGDVEIALGLRDEGSRTGQFATTSRGLDGTLRHQRELGPGTLQASYGFRYDRRDQAAASPVANVIGESQVLTGTTPRPLARPRVTPGSVTVTNATQTQTYVKNVDYTLTVVGVETRLQRLVGGAILDGEAVVVNYTYDTGGTYGSAQLDQTVNLNWGLGRYLNVYFRQYESSPLIVSGTPTFPPNVVSSSIVGARADLPLKTSLPVTVGGGLEREERRETISPYRRDGEDIYLQTDEPVFGLGSFRASARRTRVVYGSAAPGVNLSGYDLRYWARPWFGIDLSAVHAYEQDTGGFLPRRRTDDSINAQWRERKFTLTATLARSRESQGEFERSRFLFQILARREF